MLALFAMALLTSLGVALLFVTQADTRIARSDLNAKAAFFLAEAGEEDGRAALFIANGKGSFSDDLSDGSGNGAAGPDGTIDFDPGSVEVVFDGNGTPVGLTGYGDDVPLSPFAALADGYYASFLTNDPLDGVTATVDTNDQVMITGIGVGPDDSLEIISTIVEKDPLLLGTPPATITLLGPSPYFYGGASEYREYSGDDCGGNGQPGLTVPIVGTIGPDAEADAEQGIVYETCETVDGETVCEDGPTYASGLYEDEDTFADLTDPNEPTVAASGFGTIDPVWTDCQAVHDMMEGWRAAADVVCCTEPVCDPPSPATCTIPPSSPSRIIFIDGDWVIGPTDSGAGTLAVTGELRYDGKASWDGMLLVIGSGEFIQEGGGNGAISGATIVADVAGPDNIYGTADDCTGGDGGFDSVSWHLNGGGNSLAGYCSDNINNATPAQPYPIIGFRQR